MLCSIKLAPLAIIGALAVVPTLARAQAPIDLAYTPAQVGNVLGGGGASLSGGGDDLIITRSSAGAGGGGSFEQPGRIATFGGNSGGSPFWTYAAPAAGAPGREAWLVGGSDDAQVTYLNPAGMRRR
jgi:hypothetical protein